MPSTHHRPGALRRAVALSAALSTAFLLAACDDLDPAVPDGFDQPGPSPSSGTTAADLGLTWGADGVATLASGAVLHRSTGHVELPADRFLETWEEIQTLEMARNVAVAACGRLSGLDVQAVRWEVDPLAGVSQPFGAWSREVAEQYGFGVGPVDPYATQDVGDEGLPPAFAGASVGPDGFATLPEDQAVLDACYQEADAQRFDLVTVTSGGTAQWRIDLEQVWIEWQTYPEAQAVEAEYASCLAGVGAEPNPDLWGGAAGMDLGSASQPQIDLALLVVGCKEEVAYVPRLADLVAGRQAPVLEAYAAELHAYRADVDLVVEAAREVLELNADVMVQG